MHIYIYYLLLYIYQLKQCFYTVVMLVYQRVVYLIGKAKLLFHHFFWRTWTDQPVTHSQPGFRSAPVGSLCMLLHFFIWWFLISCLFNFFLHVFICCFFNIPVYFCFLHLSQFISCFFHFKSISGWAVEYEQGWRGDSDLGWFQASSWPMSEVDEGWLMATWLATARQWKSAGDNLGYQWVPSVGHQQSTSKRRSFADAARASGW